MNRPALAFLAAVILMLSSLLGAVPAWAGALVTEDGHRVRWDEGLDSLGQQTARQIPVVRKQVEAALGFLFSGGPAEVVIVRGLDRMRAEARVAVPEWAGGVCVGTRSRIVLRADLVRDGPLRSMVTTLRHEWVHLAWSRRAGKNTRRLPLWFEEGLAEEIGGGVSVDGGLRLDFAARFGNLIPFAEIQSAWPAEGATAALAYRQGRSFVRYFRDQSGWDHLQLILRDLADGKGESESLAAGSPFEELVFEYSDATVSHWHAAWRRDVKEKAAPWFNLLFRDLSGTLLFVVSLIAMAAFFVLRRTRKRDIEAMPDHPLLPGMETDEDV